MSPFLHALNIGTLATWLSVAGFGVAGIMIHPWRSEPSPSAEFGESLMVSNEIDLGDAPFNPETGMSQPSPEVPVEAADTLPAPSELPPLAEYAPLPEVPDFPEITATPATAAPAENSVREVPVRPSSHARPGPTRIARATNSGGGKPAASSSGTAAPGVGRGIPMSSAARLAAGRMPAPNYPLAARRGGQTGTVVIEFSVDASGKVISAYAKNPSPWPLLNEEAVRTVRRWSFPPGGVMKLQRPIIFQIR
jgi:protein TonB